MNSLLFLYCINFHILFYYVLRKIAIAKIKKVKILTIFLFFLFRVNFFAFFYVKNHYPRTIYFCSCFFTFYRIFFCFATLIFRLLILSIYCILVLERKDFKMDIKRKKLLYEQILSPISKIPKKMFFYPLRFLFSFLLSRAIILGGYAPFGLSASAALGMGKYGAWGLFGTILGYISVYNYINSLKYIACIILIFTANLVFEGTDLAKKRFFTPLSVVTPMLCIHFVFLASDGFNLHDVSLALLETAIAAYFSVALKWLSRPSLYEARELSPHILCAAATIIIALCDISPFGLFSVGRSLAFTLLFLSAFVGGHSIGTVVGTLLGVAVSLKYSSSSFCMIYGISALCGVFSSRSRYANLITSSLAALAVSLSLDPKTLLPCTLELATASLLFLVSSDAFLRYAGKFFSSPHGRSDFLFREKLANRMKAASRAFFSLSKTLETPSPEKSPMPDASVFERSCAHLCKKCSLLKICWQRDFETTRDALNNASLKARKKGVITARDFPIYFSSRCLQIEKFVANINREIASERYRQDFSKKLTESRNLIKKQYSDAANIFSSVAADIMSSDAFDEKAEGEIHTLLTSNGIICDSAVWRDAGRHANLHFCGHNLSSIVDGYSRLRPLFENILGVSLSLPDFSKGENYDEIVIREKPSLRGVFAASGLRKKGASTSGDSGSFFSPLNGTLALLLSDGMGSGSSAGKESAKAVSLLKGLLSSGFSPESALSSLHSALTVKTEETGAFSTLDLFYADMFTGLSSFYKLGAAPTYIKRGDKIKRISSTSLPAGLSLDGECSISKEELTLTDGDFVIMASDGICDEGDEEKLLQFISKSKETSPKALADTIVAFAAREHAENDDMTVAVILIEDNNDE